MCNPLFVANNIIDRAKQTNIVLTHMKLQKILYFVYREYIQKNNNHMPLFAERFATWQYGPVLESVYNVFKKYGSTPITDYYRDNGIAYGANEKDNPLLHEVLDCIWRQCCGFTGIELSNITHKQGSAWYKAFKNDEFFLNDKDILEDTIPLTLGVCNE